MKTQTKRVVVEATAKEFSPVWIDDQTIEFNGSTGERSQINVITNKR